VIRPRDASEFVVITADRRLYAGLTPVEQLGDGRVGRWGLRHLRAVVLSGWLGRQTLRFGHAVQNTSISST
jgi:hypothetical protein